MLNKIVTIHSRLAVDSSGITRRAYQRHGGSLGERNIRIPEMQQLQGIAGGFLNRDITRDGGHQLQVELGGKNRGGNGDGIVDAGVSIEENGYRLCHYCLSWLVTCSWL